MAYDARGKLVRVDMPASAHVNWYSGLGNLVGTDWDALSGNASQREELLLDGLGNIRQRRTPNPAPAPGAVDAWPHDVHYAYDIDPVYGRVRMIARRDTIYNPYLLVRFFSGHVARPRQRESHRRAIPCAASKCISVVRVSCSAAARVASDSDRTGLS